MKTKKLLFCLMLLLLGTATAWADKYYMPKSYRNKVNPRLTLETAVGKRFMIYNSAVDYDAVDRTGFLRNGGAEFAHDKSKERDLFIYNESFVYTLEAFDDNKDGHNDWYAIKSLSTGTYVDCNGKTTHKNPQDAKLNIYNWAAANKVGAADWVNMECWEYNIIAREDIEHQDVVFVIGGKYTQGGQEKSAYWNGATNSFATDQWHGHPYVFYEAIELTNEDELPITIEKDFLQELHVYSRCDMYAAQRVCGLVHVHDHNDSTHITIPGRQESAHGIHLCDGDILTSVTVEAGKSIEFLPNNGGTPSNVHIYLQRNADRTERPESIKVEVLGANGEWTQVDGSPFAVEDLSPSFTTGEIVLGEGYSRIRISNADITAPMSLSEVYILPSSDVLKDIMDYVNETSEPDNVIFTKASAQVYADTLERYNESFPTVKLFSGVPYPGNKYRIFADVPNSANEHEKKHIYVDGEKIIVGGRYFADGITAEEREKYEWYCEKLPNGTLAFKNAVTGKYLDFDADGSGTAFGWNIYTSLSLRNGVPLYHGGNYLAVNSANLEFVQGKSVVGYGDYTTEFVFLPVNMSEGEKKITIKANELVMRNTELKYNGTVYSMPFSHIFTENDLPILELQCPVIHPFKGVKVNGVAKENIATQVEKNGVKVLEFNWANIENGDVLELVFEIKKPFDVTPAATETTKEPKPKLYFIRNKRPYGLQPQQARPNRAADANIGIEDGDGPISVVGDKFDYAKFDSRGTEMHLVQDKKDNPTSLDATSLFFFTQTESNDSARYYSVNVNNATTVMKFSTTGVWDEEGGTWYVQPDKAGAYSGYSIGATKLNATNNPSDAWCNVKGADIISFSTPDDDGTAWEFVPVSDDVAKVMLKTFIDKVAAELLAKFSEIADVAAERGYDMEKVGYYEYMVEELVRRVGNAGDGGYYDTDDIFKLVQYAQNIHMIEHEVVYALYELPQLSDETMMDDEAGFANPKWYYVRNVVSGNYAAYTSYDRAMNLEQNPTGTYPDGGMLLKNMFYFAGNKNSYAPLTDKDLTNDSLYVNHPGNNLILDEYLKVHVHNFMSKQLTLVSKNQAVLTLNDTCPGHGIQKIKDIPGGLGSTENWSIDVVYELDGSSFNAYGSCLLSSQADALNDAFPNAFQVYFKDNRTVAIRAGNRNWDLVVFNHTQEFFSTVRVVVSYAYGTLTIEVYNSAGDVRVWSEKMELNNITALYSALPYDEETNSGIKVNSLVVKKTEKMNWKEHLEGAQYDLWYILPSSNLNNKGFAITLDGPNETNIGWTNASGIIDTDLGNQNNSSWQFERVTDFDNHIDELLAMYNLKNCVIYNKELAKLMKLIAYNSALIKANTNGELEEKLFNEVYYAILNYNGPMPDELKAPKPGSLYTIRSAVEENTENALLVHVDANDENYSTKEVYNGAVVRDEEEGKKSYDPRGVWMFEETAGQDGFLPLSGLQVKNIHTQCYFTALDNAATTINENAPADVTLAPLGACTTMFQVGEQYLNTTASAAVRYAMDADFWGSAITEYPAEVAEKFAAVNGASTVHSKTFDVLVSEQGNVTVTFTHNGGQHKLNILGVTLTDINGKVVAGNYRHATAGGNPTTQTYTLTNVLPATYTLNCYVCELNGGDNDKLQRAQGDITFSGISQFKGAAKVTNGGNENTKWIIEEIQNPEESVYYETSTNINGHSTLMLGFPSKIPSEVEAFYGSTHGNMLDGRYLSMTSYDNGILPANTPVVLRNKSFDASNPVSIEGLKFYYSATTVDAVEDNYLYGSLYWTLVDCSSFNDKDVDGDGNAEDDVKIYMLQASKQDVKMFWVYENYRYDGTKTGNNDEGGYVLCKANKAYMVLPSDLTNASSLSFRFDGNGNTTEIDEVEFETVKTIYDLQGRKLDAITAPGIYIVNGVKVLVK